jgi:hypothetical protein
VHGRIIGARRRENTNVPTNFRAAIYGLITVGALVAADSARRATYGKTVGAVVLALILYWLAHSYAEFASRRLQQRQPLAIGGLAQATWHELPLLSGAGLPLLAILVSWAVGASLSSAINAAVWTVAGAIVVVEVISGLRAKLSGRELLLQSAIGAGLGLLVLALHSELH